MFSILWLISMSIGTCKLTGKRGKFVRSHLIPKAFTRPEEPGLPFIQQGVGQRPIKRWDSWYDKSIVTREGENILEELDDWSIKFLRDDKLVWSGWGLSNDLGALEKRIPGINSGIRSVNIKEPHKLRLFILSLLWRAAVSKLPEFKEINLDSKDLETLRRLIIESDPGPISFYPATLIQLSTKGFIHNQTPIRQIKVNPSIEGSPEMEIDIFRFYFDGLVIHIHIQSDDDGYTESLGNLIVGQEKEITITTVPFEDSFQLENIIRLAKLYENE